MEISKEQLEAFITRALQLFEQEKERKKKRACVLFSGEWNGKFAEFFHEEKLKEYEFTAILSREQAEEEEFLKVATANCKKILLRDEAERLKLYEKTTIYPVMHRDIVAKAALCIPDVFEVAWMQKAFETGGVIKVMADGLDSFSGQEPERYKERILSYLKTMLEYGIEIVTEEGREVTK